MYNAHHREGKESQYTWENVAIVPGGRAGLIRIAAILNQAYLGFFIPDYTAYNEMLSLFRNVSIEICLRFDTVGGLPQGTGGRREGGLPLRASKTSTMADLDP